MHITDFLTTAYREASKAVSEIENKPSWERDIEALTNAEKARTRAVEDLLSNPPDDLAIVLTWLCAVIDASEHYMPILRSDRTEWKGSKPSTKEMVTWVITWTQCNAGLAYEYCDPFDRLEKVPLIIDHIDRRLDELVSEGDEISQSFIEKIRYFREQYCLALEDALQEPPEPDELEVWEERDLERYKRARQRFFKRYGEKFSFISEAA